MKVLVVATERVEKLKKPLTSAGCDVSVISPEIEASLLSRYTTYLSTIWKEIRTGEYDVIITRGAGFVGTTAIMIGRPHQIPVFPRIAGDQFAVYKENVSQAISKCQLSYFFHTLARFVMFLFCMSMATGVIVVSDFLKDQYSFFSKWMGQTFIVVPVSIDHHSHTRGKNKIPTDGQILLTVTNLNFKGKYEGVKKSVRAAIGILKERSDLKYVIAGDGRYHEHLQAYVKAHSPNEDVFERIHVPGYIDPISPLYYQADVFVYFSYQDGYPNVVLEAMSHGLPVVTNDAVGMSEQVVHDRSGIFADANDTSDIQAKITSLLDDPEKRKRLGSRAQVQVKRANSHETVGLQYVRELRSVIE